MMKREFEFNPYGGFSAYHGSDAHVRIPRWEPKFHICSRAFANNKSLEVVEIPEGVYRIDQEAFMDCENLREVILPSTLHTIYDHAFAGCVNLRSIRFPNGIYRNLYTTPNVFAGCTALGDENGLIIIDGILRSYCGSGDTVTIPEGVRSIAEGVFAGQESITEVHLPEVLEEIRRDAFRGCKNLTRINIPSSVSCVDRSAFDGCDGLWEPGSDFLILDGWLCGYRGPGGHVVITQGVTSIADHAFYKYKPRPNTPVSDDDLTSVIIPQGVTRIGNWAFMECRILTEVTLPESLRILCWMAFANCIALKKINMPAGLTELGSRVFENCTSLEEITVPSGIREIPGDAFRNCSALTAVHLPEGVTHIGSNAFQGCRNLRDIRIPESVVSVGENAFLECLGLAQKDGLVIAAGYVTNYHGPGGEVVIPEGITEINRCAFQDSRVTKVILPKGLRKIHDRAFSGCRELETVILSEGLEHIGDDAFYGCALTQIDLPKSLQYIGRDAFSGDIREVTIPNSLRHLGDQTFQSCPVRQITIPEPLFRDYGTIPGENSRWIDNYIDINPFNYKNGQMICANVICQDFWLSSNKLSDWTKLLQFEHPLVQVWESDWDSNDDQLCLNGRDFFDYEEWDDRVLVPLEFLDPEELDIHGDGDFLVSILNLDRITTLIREDDIAVMGFLAYQGPENLQTLLSIAEEAKAQQVIGLLREKLT